MQIFLIPTLLSLAIIFIGSYYQVSLRYLVLFFIPWVSTGWFYLDFGSTLIKPSQILFLALLVIVFSRGLVKKSMAQSALIMLTPFVITLLYNYFFFTPIEVFEVDSGSRDLDRGELRTALNLSNITRLIYLIFGLLLYLVFSSIHLEKARIKTVLDTTIYFLVFVAALQLATWYLDIYLIYETIFYPLDTTMQDQMAKFPIFDFKIKRVNGTFSEPSFFGYYLICTLLFYLTFFGKKIFFASWPVRLAVFIGLLSTATTFLWGSIGVCVITYLFYTDRKYKVLFYFVLLILLGLALREFTVEGFIDSKRGSVPVRWHYGWVLPSQQIMDSLYFGYALGTSFTQFIYTLIPHSIGFVGVIIFFYGLFMVPCSKAKKLYLFGIFWLGIGNFYFGSAEMWIYLGLLSNSRFNMQNELAAR